MPAKIARSAPRPSLGPPELLVAIHTSRQSCSKAGKARIFALVWESSGESRPIPTKSKASERRTVSNRKQRLELTWIGKDQRTKLEPRILIEDQSSSYHAATRRE